MSNVTGSTEGADAGTEIQVEGDAVVPDSFSMPYFSPLIFVPPIPFVSGNLKFSFSEINL